MGLTGTVIQGLGVFLPGSIITRTVEVYSYNQNAYGARQLLMLYLYC